MSSISAPRIRRTAQNTQFTYNLSRRVNDVQTYPVQSPQGATILIYGHENGVTVVWRGGRRFKPTKKTPPKKQNGAPDDSIMIIDSDDDQPPAKTKSASVFEDKPQFEAEIEDSPYPEIVQTLDLALGTAVLKVAVLPMVPTPAEDAAWGGAKILTERIVFTVSCVSNDVYVITLPLTPPSPESKERPELRNDLLAGKAGSGAWGESLILLGGQAKHSEGIAMNLIMPKANERPGTTKPRAVVASHSREASGVLRLWDVPLEPKDKPSKPIEPFQTEYLPTPLTSISFNTSHTTQLLVVSALQGVRIYDFAQPSLPPDPEATGPFPVQGSWLLSLYQPFSRPSSSRKPILDAAWIAHGRAVLVLLADGMWGIWDIDGVSPTGTGAALSNKLKSGVRGAALTTFSVSGYVEGTGSLRSVATQAKESSTGEFAPMTPHTRRQATASLSSAMTLDRLATIRGGIEVTGLPAYGKAVHDEAVVLWVGNLDHVCIIPGISKFWDSQLRKESGGGGGNLFNGAQSVRMVRLLDLSTGLLGERCCGVGIAIDPNRGETQEDEFPADVLLLGESRIVIVREGDDGPGKKIGSLANTRRRIFSRAERSDAIIVHGAKRAENSGRLNFNLSTVKPGTLRLRSATTKVTEGDEDGPGSSDLFKPSRPRVGFEFVDTLNDAADLTDDFTTRDVEVEMLDIMEIDKTLDSMDSSRDNGTRKTLFGKK